MALALEHGSRRSARWLRRYRLRLAVWTAVVEGVLILLGVVPGWPALVVAGFLIAFYALLGRNLPSDAARQVSWIAAVSQLFVGLLPLLVALLTLAAVAALVILALVALVLLFLDRR